MRYASTQDDASKVRDEVASANLDLADRCVVALGMRGAFIEFEFTVGDPLLTVELIMPPAAFVSFCRQERARVSLPPAVAAVLAAKEAMPPAARILIDR